MFRAMGRGCAHGALAWLTFGLVEYLCLSVLPAWRESSLLLTPAARLAALGATLAAYSLLGAVAGALAAAASPRNAADLATATLPLVWIPHLAAARGFSRSAYLVLAMAGLLLVVLAVRVAIRREGWNRVTAWLAAPAGAALCLLVPLVFRDQLHISPLTARFGHAAGMVKDAATAAGALALVLLLAAGARICSRGPGTGWASRLATAATLAAAVLAAGRLLDARSIGQLGEGATHAAPVPGVVLISLDAVRADHLSAYGYRYPTSPSLASLAGRATLYLDARAASDMSLGAHASLFTGRYPSRHGAWVGGPYPFGRPLPAAERTLAERLGQAGWARFASVANGYFLNRAYGLSRGFQVFDVPDEDRLELRYRLRRVVGRVLGQRATVNRTGDEVNDVLAMALEAARAGGRPYLAFVNYMEAHAPYTPDADLVARFPGYDPTLPPAGGAFVDPEGSRKVADPRERRHLVSQYDGGVASLDRRLGALLDRMRSLGLYDPALIIVVGDHGEMLGERGVFGHGAGLVDEVLRVPLVVKYPYQREGRRVSIPVSQVDVLPTVLQVLGLPPDPSLNGVSLLEVERQPRRVVLAEAPPWRWAYDGRSARLRRVAGSAYPGPADPDSLDRLKSLGYVR